MAQLIQNTLSRFVDSGEIAGCSARIMRGDEVLFEGHFGYANIENKIRMSEDSKIRRSRRKSRTDPMKLWTPRVK